MKEINQTEFKDLFRNIYFNQASNVNMPIFIWEAYWGDGIFLPSLLEVVGELNENKRLEKHCCFKLIKVSGEDTHLRRPNRKDRAGAYIVTTLNLSKEDYLSEVFRLIAENESRYPLVVCMPYRLQDMDLPGEQFLYRPDFSLWASEFSDSLIPDFILGDGDPEGIRYRWYNGFNNLSQGCPHPSLWAEASCRLKMYARLKGFKSDRLSIYDLSAEEIHRIFDKVTEDSWGNISYDIVDGFIEYLHSLRKEETASS